jgi:hypothetical protein
LPLEQHFTYLTLTEVGLGEVVDAFWDGGAKRWSSQMINSADMLSGGKLSSGSKVL